VNELGKTKRKERGGKIGKRMGRRGRIGVKRLYTFVKQTNNVERVAQAKPASVPLKPN